jgi:thioredoxin-like negative regulator of GroEL
MPVLQMTGATADRILEDNPFVIIDFWAPWCAPCRAFERVFQAAAEKHPEITFCRVNIEEEKGLMEAFEIKSIPNTAVMRDHVLLLMQPGALSGPVFEKIIEQAKALDMTQFRADLESDPEGESS